jgi:hypothetical protein
MRYEIAVDAEFDLSPRRQGWRLGDALETVDVWFQKRRFLWHPGDAENCPIVTTPYEGDDFTEESVATERFLSALSRTHPWGLYLAGVAFGEGHGTDRDEFDVPTWKQPRRYGRLVHRVAPELVVPEDDTDLMLCLGLLREGRNAHSVALTYLSYWKVMEVVVGNDESVQDKWISKQAKVLRGSWDPDPSKPRTDWAHRLRKSRIQAAHAIPRKDLVPTDPDDTRLRDALRGDASKVHLLAVRAMHERWGDHPVVESDPPEELLGQNIPYR